MVPYTKGAATKMANYIGTARNRRNATLCLGVSLCVVLLILSGPTSGSLSAATLRIMPLGDSITSGYTNQNWSGAGKFTFGYRGPLYTLLNKAGYKFQFVGASTEPWKPARIFQDDQWFTAGKGPTAVAGPDLRKLKQDGHRGYWGQRTDFIASNIVQWLEADKPDIILLMIGINDTDMATRGSSAEPTKSEEQLKGLVETIVRTKPDAKVIVAQITPFTESTPSIVKYNRYIAKTLVPYFVGRGDHVSMVDQYANFVRSNGSLDPSVSADTVHPNSIGYARMAHTWLKGIEAVATP